MNYLHATRLEAALAKLADADARCRLTEARCLELREALDVAKYDHEDNVTLMVKAINELLAARKEPEDAS